MSASIGSRYRSTPHTYLTVTAGKGTWLATTDCPGGKWPFSATTTYLNPNTNATGSTSFSASIRCHG